MRAGNLKKIYDVNFRHFNCYAQSDVAIRHVTRKYYNMNRYLFILLRELQSIYNKQQYNFFYIANLQPNHIISLSAFCCLMIVDLFVHNYYCIVCTNNVVRYIFVSHKHVYTHTGKYVYTLLERYVYMLLMQSKYVYYIYKYNINNMVYPLVYLRN